MPDRTRAARQWKVPVAAESTSAVYEGAAGEQLGVFVCAHGAGGHMHDRATVAATQALRQAGLGVVRFNFLYKEQGKGGPDRMPRLMECFAAVATAVRAEIRTDRFLIGGRSMGGRTASMLAADGFDADGLLLLAYPLHPPGQLERLRVEHLPAIRMPVLCFNGTRDSFCERPLMDAALRQVSTAWTMRWIQDADHGFHVPKKSGRTDADVMNEVKEETARWLETLR